MFGGIVVHGDSLGKELGYPTANLNIAPKKIKYKDGIYAARAYLKKKEYKSALIIRSEAKKVEVHLFNYLGSDFYGLYVEVEPIQKVSEIEHHDNLAGLKKKIEQDIELVKEVF